MIKYTANAAVIVPAFGPEVINFFGLIIPVMPFGLGLVGLLLARSIAPASRRKLTRMQEVSLTILLILLLLMIVTGQFGGAPLKSGMASIWGIGLGLSGLVAIEFIGQIVISTLKTMLGNMTK